MTHSVTGNKQATLELNLPLRFELQVEQLHSTNRTLLEGEDFGIAEVTIVGVVCTSFSRDVGARQVVAGNNTHTSHFDHFAFNIATHSVSIANGSEVLHQQVLASSLAVLFALYVKY